MPTYLTKSLYLAGLDCAKRLWLLAHERPPFVEPPLGTPTAFGREVGALARQHAPGVLVDVPPWDRDQAVRSTAALIGEQSVPAIYEGAFDADNVHVRADILERLPGDTWRLLEAKSNNEVAPEHIPDLAIQTHVLRRQGIPVSEIAVVHVNGAYVRGDEGLDPRALLTRTDVTDQVTVALEDVPTQIATFHDILAAAQAPDIKPGKHCPDGCEFWERCTSGKPKDWVINVPNLRAPKFNAYEKAGYLRIGDIPDGEKLSDQQTRVRDAHRANEAFVSPDLADALVPFGPPAFYLDFETFSPPIPVYPGTRPYEVIPFQWSIHWIAEDGTVEHHEFLADGSADPRRALAEALLAVVKRSNAPVISYTSYEKRILNELAAHPALADLAADLRAVIGRLADLHAVIKDHFYHPDFYGSLSIKSVGPALVPALSYDGLAVNDGQAAGAAFYRLVTGATAEADRPKVRADLLAYCGHDSWAMVEVHRALREVVQSAPN